VSKICRKVVKELVSGGKGKKQSGKGSKNGN
jgi:hypothetical protein